MHDDPTLRQVIRGLAPSVFGGYTYRGVNSLFLDTVNSVAGSVKANGRFSHKADRLGVLYVGLARAHVLSEVEDDAGSIFIPTVLNPPQYYVAVFHLDLQRVIDLRRPDVQAALGTSPQELSGSWKLENYTYHQHAPTQRLARAAAQEGMQAIRYLSVKAPQLENLAVFVHNVPTPLSASPDPKLPAQVVQDAQSTPELQ